MCLMWVYTEKHGVCVCMKCESLMTRNSYMNCYHSFPFGCRVGGIILGKSCVRFARTNYKPDDTCPLHKAVSKSMQSCLNLLFDSLMKANLANKSAASGQTQC